LKNPPQYVARLADRSTCPTNNTCGSPFAVGNSLAAQEGSSFATTSNMGKRTCARENSMGGGKTDEHLTPMRISSKATDTIYQTVLELLHQHGLEENEPLVQSVLLGDGVFLGYRFQGISVQIDWLAQNNTLVVKDFQGNISLHNQVGTQSDFEADGSPEDDLSSSAA